MRRNVARAGIAAGLMMSACGLQMFAAARAAEVDEPSIPSLQADYAAGRMSVRATVSRYLGRIRRIDASGPALHAIIETNPDASSIAATLDQTPASARGPLHGIPVVIKDNVDTADRMLTTAGSLALAGSRPARDAFIVRKLRAAGAVILGKTNLSEWANYRSTRSSSGWSGRGGQTHNPYSPDRNSCGSSSGSGAAVAADLAVIAVGTETDGSIICPSAINGLVGIKPTVGLVSRSGIIPISASQDTAGPMARSVADAAALLNVLAGYDPDDAATAVMKDRPAVDYSQSLKPDSLRGARIGVLRKFAGFHEAVDGVFEQALTALRAQGAVLVEVPEFDIDAKTAADEGTVLSYEFKDGINRYLASRPAPTPRTLTDLIAFNESHAAQEMPYFGQELFLAANSRGPLSDTAYLGARQRSVEAAGKNGIDAVLAAQQLDALVAPSNGPAWTIDVVNGDHFVGGSISAPAAIAGYPHVTVPMGQVHGLPVGLSLLGAAFSEAKLISYAFAFENATHSRRPPTFKMLNH
jgi:amidase